MVSKGNYKYSHSLLLSNNNNNNNNKFYWKLENN